MVSRPMFISRVRMFKLSCGHVVILPLPMPSIGDKQWCQRCADYHTVYSRETMFHTRCRCRAATRSHKTDRDTVMAYARKHVASKPTHLVEVFEDDKKTAEVRNTEDSLFSTHADIREIAKWNQDILRQNDICPNCRSTRAKCNESGCGQRQSPGWRDVKEDERKSYGF